MRLHSSYLVVAHGPVGERVDGGDVALEGEDDEEERGLLRQRPAQQRQRLAPRRAQRPALPRVR